MREIKFRAWDDEKKQMTVRWNNSGDDGATTYVNPDGEIIAAPQFTLMQYTGLKDKNGKEIYEGDVIEKKQGEQKFRYVVQFSGGAFGIEFPSPSYEFKTLHELFYTFQSKYEIIGNIYENPELLKL